MAPKPYVIVNVAQSLNGMIAGVYGRKVGISSQKDLERVHRLRASVDAIVVGANTILNDNPGLLVNDNFIKVKTQPSRIILDRKLRIDPNSKAVDGSADTIIYTAVKRESFGYAEVRTRSSEDLSPVCILSELYNSGMRRILVEGGRQVISEFIMEGVIDEFYIYVGNLILEDGGMTLFQPGFEIRDIIKDIEPMETGVLISLDPYHLQRSWRIQAKDI